MCGEARQQLVAVLRVAAHIRGGTSESDCYSRENYTVAQVEAALVEVVAGTDNAMDAGERVIASTWRQPAQ